MGTITKSGDFAQNYQAEWTYDDSGEGDGSSLSASYEDDVEGWVSRLPARGSTPPATVGAEFSSFRLQKRTANRLPGGKVKVTLRYESERAVDEDPGEEDEIRRYSMQVTLSEENILTHPRYADIPEEERTALTMYLSGQRFKTEEGKERWKDDVVTERGKEMLEKIDDGISAYLEPTLLWRERFRTEWSKVADEVEIAKIGNIDDEVPGNPPMGGDRNYLYLGAQIDQDESGEFADILNEWQLSGRNGWDEELYNEEEN